LPPPRLMLTATTFCAAARDCTYSRPAMISDVNAPGHGAIPPQLAASVISVKTWTAISFAPFATPENDCPAGTPLPAAMPATCVPWRQSGRGDGGAGPGAARLATA